VRVGHDGNMARRSILGGYRSRVNPVLLLAVRALVGGTFVVVFALVGEVVTPKRFAGIFGAAPSVTLANLALVVAIEGIPTQSSPG